MSCVATVPTSETSVSLSDADFDVEAARTTPTPSPVDNVDIVCVAAGSGATGPPLPARSGRTRKSHSYAWLSKISTINLELCGSDLSQRIELACPNGPCFKTDIKKRKDDNGLDLEDQKQFTVINNRNEKLLTVDFSSDRKSFHIMEPDSNTFIGFFTVQTSIDNTRVNIHNVIDDEIYHADPTETPFRLVITSEKGEEMATISRLTPKWTQFLSGTMSLNYTGDEREGLTTREKAIVLGFLIALGIFGMDYWKRSSSGIYTFYFFCILIFTILVIFLYSRFTVGIGIGYKTLKPSINNIKNFGNGSSSPLQSHSIIGG